MVSNLGLGAGGVKYISAVIDLVRVDVPKQNVEIDYKKIESLSDNSKDLAMVLGISNVTNPNVTHPYILTQVANELGFSYWSYANDLLKKANTKLGYDIKSSNNKYHMAIKSGTKQLTHKYSEELIKLLAQVRDEDLQPTETPA